MSECKNGCGNELTGRQRQFCSDRCRMQYKRLEPEQVSKPEQPEPEQMQVEHEPEQGTLSVMVLTKDQLHAAIRRYPEDSWVGSPEHRELMRRLDSMSIEQLKDEGYEVPAWKRQGKAPGVLV